MNRMHIHIDVKDLEQSIAFYSTLFGAPPVVTKGEYAKWILDDPALNSPYLKVQTKRVSIISVYRLMPGMDCQLFQSG